MTSRDVEKRVAGWTERTWNSDYNDSRFQWTQ